MLNKFGKKRIIVLLLAVAVLYEATVWYQNMLAKDRANALSHVFQMGMPIDDTEQEISAHGYQYTKSTGPNWNDHTNVLYVTLVGAQHIAWQDEYRLTFLFDRSNRLQRIDVEQSGEGL
jgi:hypothetical protein